MSRVWKNKSSNLPGRKLAAPFSRYTITEKGEVFSMITGRMKKAWVDSHGYVCVGIQTDEGKTKIRRVHVLIAQAYLGERPKGFEVCHCDGNKLNNSIENLRYDSHVENMADVFRHGYRAKAGAEQPNASLTDDQVADIRRDFVRSGPRVSNINKLAEKYGVHRTTISGIVRMRSYKTHDAELIAALEGK